MENLKEALEPISRVLVEAHLASSVLLKHYVKTISELTGKSEQSIKDELNALQEEEKVKLQEKLKPS